MPSHQSFPVGVGIDGVVLVVIAVVKYLFDVGKLLLMLPLITTALSVMIGGRAKARGLGILHWQASYSYVVSSQSIHFYYLHVYFSYTLLYQYTLPHLPYGHTSLHSITIYRATASANSIAVSRAISSVSSSASVNRSAATSHR